MLMLQNADTQTTKNTKCSAVLVRFFFFNSYYIQLHAEFKRVGINNAFKCPHQNVVSCG